MPVPILCYHQVGRAEDWGRRLNIEPETLASHVAFFRGRGWKFLRAEDFSPDEDRAICLTFDDAFASAVEQLKRFAGDFTASVYAVPSLVGLNSAWEGEDARPLACWDSLRNLHRLGFEIGNHSYRHLPMGDLSLERQVEEWTRAGERLASEGLASRSCCLPYGSRNAETSVAIERAGYGVGLGLGARPARASDDRRLLPRIVVAYSDRLPRLMYRLWVRPFLPTLRRREHYVA